MQSTVQYSKCSDNFHFYPNVTDPLIIPLIFISLPCRERAHDNNKFCCENENPCRQSQITIC